MRIFKVGQQVVAKYQRPWFAHPADVQTFGPSYDEICTVTAVDISIGICIIKLEEYPCNIVGPCWWQADCFEPLITSSQLEEALTEEVKQNIL